MSDASLQNVISSTRFQEFFHTFSQSLLANLKHLRLHHLTVKNGTAFAQSCTQVLNSFSKLEQLDLFRLNDYESDLEIDFELNLQMLNGLHLENFYGFQKLTLNSPRLTKIKLGWCSESQSLDIVYPDSVETLLIEDVTYVAVNKLKNLKHLYCGHWFIVDSTLLSGLEQLKEVHLNRQDDVAKDVSQLFEQKQRYSRTELKIYRFGLCCP